MSMKGLTARIAWRYLRAPKSYSAVSAISVIAVTGVAVATAAIICVLSVFNGFRSLLNDRLDTLAPDIMVTPAAGKTFANGDSIADIVSSFNDVEIAMPVVSDNALLIAEAREMPVKLKGVNPALYSRITSIDSIIFEGNPLESHDNTGAVISIGVANRLGIYAAGGDLFVFTPKREGRINMANPMSSFLSDSLKVNGIFQAQQSDYDENTVYCDISVARDLLEYSDEATGIEILARHGTDIEKLSQQISERLGTQFVVKDRARQQEMNFRMVSIEKWITFLLLVFILIIASFNIISTMCMLILEKEQSLSIFSALGMRKSGIGATFWWEGLFVSMGGGIVGVALGLVLCLLQQHFGFIKLNGNSDALIMDAYPVVVEWIDILWAMLPVTVIGLITSFITSAFARSRLKKIAI